MTALYDSSKKTLVMSHQNKPQWIGGVAPLDRPKCGLQNEKCPATNTVLVVAVVAFVGVILLVLIIFR